LPALEYLIPLLAFLLLSLSVHEAAHAWTADRLGDPTARMLGRITLNPLAHIDWIGTVLFPLISVLTGFPLLGWAKPVPVNFRNLKAPRRDFAFVALAGPVSNLVLAALATPIFLMIYGDGDPEMVSILAARFVVLNVSLAVFNMIPFPPLDGGNVLSGFVPESVAAAIDQLRPYGFIILYALLFTGALSRFVFPVAFAITTALRIPEWAWYPLR
jgi:Zn-dependent protease